MVEERETVKLDDSERQRCEVWTRVMGYHRPVSGFNPGKHQEHMDRLHFLEELHEEPTERTVMDASDVMTGEMGIWL